MKFFSRFLPAALVASSSLLHADPVVHPWDGTGIAYEFGIGPDGQNYEFHIGTIEGMGYELRSSQDLINWQTESIHRGTGQNFRFPLFAAPQGGLDPGTSPVAPEDYVAPEQVGIRYSRIVDGTGNNTGFHFRWVSLEDGISVKNYTVYGQTLHEFFPPVYFQCHGNFYYSMGYFGEQTQPPVNDSITGKDAEMVSTWLDNLDGINAEAAAQQIASMTHVPVPPDPGGRKFFRLRPVELDSDGDGWADHVEAAYGTDYLNRDTDGDGIDDPYDPEPLANGAIADPDGAGLSAALNSGLLARWDFEPTNGQTGLEDKSGNNKNLAIAGQPLDQTSFTPSGMVSYASSLQQGHFKRQAKFLKDDTYSSSIDINTEMSVSLWLKLDKDLISGSSARIGIWNAGMSEQYYAQAPNGNTYNWVDYRTYGISVKKNVNGDELWGVGQYAYRNDHDGLYNTYQKVDPFAGNPATNTEDGNEIKWIMPAGTSDGGNTWIHLVLVRDRDEGLAGKTKAYVNGVKVAEENFRAWALDNQAEWDAPECQMFLGQVYSALNGNAPAEGQFKGCFDRVRLYKKALSSSQVLELYHQDIDADGLWDVSEQKSLLWRDHNGDGIRTPDEDSYTASPFYHDPAWVDHDGDDLTSLDEQNIYGTDLANPDSDRDLMPDGWEVTYSLNPLSPADATLDGDNDGLDNLGEYSYASNPNNPHTDTDGVNDGTEASQGSLPSDASDNGQPLPDEEKVSILLGVGDQSGSESEDYVMNVFELDATTGNEKRIYTLRSGGFGQYSEETKSFFRKDRSYSFQIDWQRSNLGSSGDSNNPDGADFDYTMKVEPQNDDAGFTVDGYDPGIKHTDSADAILGEKGDVENFREKTEKKRVVRSLITITPDYNRDGVINEADMGMVTEENPYRFWINDDDDVPGEERKSTSNDIPGTSSDALQDQYIDGLRDLVDFFPVYVDLRQALKLFPKDQYRYKLKHENEALNYFVYHECVPDGSSPSYSPGSIYRNATIGRKYANQSNPYDPSQIFKKVENDGTRIYLNVLKSIEMGKGVFFMEGRYVTDKPLILEISNSEGVVATAKLPLRLSNVENMYRHINLRAAAGGSGGRTTQLGVPSNYPDDLPGLTSSKYFVLLHGYNVNGEQARGWHAEFFKRMWWSGSKAKYVGVSWHGEESQIGSLTPNYHANVVNAFQTSDDLASALNNLNGEISIAAHSLGNMVVSSAITDHNAPITNYMMFDAAVAIESYDGDAEKKDTMFHPEWGMAQYGGPFPEKVWASEWYSLPWPEGDKRKELTWRGRLEPNLAVNYYNFYSSGEEVLREHTDQNSIHFFSFVDEAVEDFIFGDAETGIYSWVFQEKLKGRTATGELLGSRWGGWGFNFTRKSGFDPVTGAYWQPQDAANLTDAELMSNPYWRRGGEDPGVSEPHPGLFAAGEAGSDYAAQNRAVLLAEGFPARTLPAGANPIPKFDLMYGDEQNHNFNMMNMKNGWYSQDPGDQNWLHGDIKDVGYTFTYRVYEKFVELGNLNQ